VKTFIVFCLLFCTLHVASQEEYIAPAPPGPWNVGKRLLEWVDSSRIDRVDSSRFRTIPVWVWYPTGKNETMDPHYALTDEWRKAQGEYLDNKIGHGGSDFIQHLKVWAKKDAPPPVTNEKFPLLIFGPGHTWLPTDYSTLIEDIVSNGYIVVGYVPTGLAGVSELSNGEIIKGKLTVQEQDLSFDDALFVRKQLKTLSNSWLKNNIDLSSVGIFGHSQGGVASVVAAARDTTIKAFVNLDGDLMASALNAKTTQPALLFSNDERVGMASATAKMDKEGRERSEYRRHADFVRATDNSKVVLRIRIDDIRHLNFTDLALVPAGKMTSEEMKNKIGNVNGADDLKIIAQITREFFDTFLKNKTFYTMVDLEKKFPNIVALLWKGLPAYK
jgi:hypothetical protein